MRDLRPHYDWLFPTDVPVEQNIGKKIGLMWPRGIANLHDAAPLLHEYSNNGCPVTCNKNWSKEEIVAALQRGPHLSAHDPLARQCLHDETNDKIEQGYAKVIRWSTIKNNIPASLKISPVAMIPHKSRKFRCILDLSFTLQHNNKPIDSVNTSTHLMAPQKAMAELGSALKRIIATLADTHNLSKPWKFTKVDIKDGYWRLVVHDDDAWNFAYVLSPATE